MKSLLIIILCSMLTACMNPLPSDFKGKRTQGMTEEDVLIMWRLSKEVNERESLELTHEDSLLAHQYVEPFLDQLIPRIFKDIEDKKLLIYKYVGMGMPSEKTFDVQAKIETLNGGKIEDPQVPFRNKIHFNVSHLKQDKDLEGEFIDIMLIWHDENHLLPERVLGIVRMDDLQELGYTIDINNKSYPIDAYIKGFCLFKIFPTSYRTVEYDVGLETLYEAFYLKDHLLTGTWHSLSWVKNVRPNLNYSGKEPVELSEDAIQEFIGIYAFSSPESDSDTLFMEIFIRDEYLLADWADWTFRGVFYPSSEKSLFNRHGQEIVFSKNNEITLIPRPHSGKEVMVGQRME